MYWRTVVAIAAPIAYSPLVIIYNRPESKCGYTVLLMATFWVTESLPVAVTALLPIAMFPLMGILSSEQVCSCYMNDTIMIFIGGLILALAIEHSNLHMRIALAVMHLTGCSHKRLLAGLIGVTTFLSMWISNTATAAMMIPIIFAILNELEQEGLAQVFERKRNAHDEESESYIEIDEEIIPSRITTAYLLAIAYSSTIGGTGTIVGTGTNLVFKGIFEKIFPNGPDITFTTWMFWSLPQVIVNVSLTWLYLQISYMGMFRPDSEAAKTAQIGPQGVAIANKVITEKYENLGRMDFHELSVSIVFGVCVILWMFRSPGFMTGWADLLIFDNTKFKIKDSTPVVLCAFLLFTIPKKPKFVRCWRDDPAERPKFNSEGLLTIEVLQEQIPWSLLFLLGGGFAISDASNASGLSVKVGQFLTPLKTYPPYAILIIVCLIVTSVTDFTSNIGIANIILPIVAQMSISMNMNPLFLMIPVTIICSYAFRLPVGTPPNAIVTAVGRLPLRDLFVGGCIPSIYTFIVVLTVFPTWGAWLYDAYENASWITDGNRILMHVQEY